MIFQSTYDRVTHHSEVDFLEILRCNLEDYILQCLVQGLFCEIGKSTK